MIDRILKERQRNIGNFNVGRILPFGKRRTVGPFIFVDHMGPAELPAGEGMDVLSHPHIGLATVTYLFEGVVTHRDSLGVEQDIRPGEVNWMTAGSGITHSERTPDEARATDFTMHGMQVWVALPKENEDDEPSFHHIPAEDVPRWEAEGLKFTLIVGEAFGYTNPAPTASPLFYVDIQAEQAGTFSTEGWLFGEWALYVLEGRATLGNTTIEAQHMAVLELGAFPEVQLEAGTRALIFGGDTLPEERHIFWNFVHSNPQKIEEAKARWKAQEFPKIDGEKGFVPLPE